METKTRRLQQPPGEDFLSLITTVGYLGTENGGQHIAVYRFHLGPREQRTAF